MSKVEDYIKNHTKEGSNELRGWVDGELKTPYMPWLTPYHAKAVAQIARKEVIEKVCEWIKKEYEDIGLRWMRGYEANDLIESFKKAMEVNV